MVWPTITPGELITASLRSPPLLGGCDSTTVLRYCDVAAGQRPYGIRNGHPAYAPLKMKQALVVPKGLLDLLTTAFLLTRFRG